MPQCSINGSDYRGRQAERLLNLIFSENSFLNAWHDGISINLNYRRTLEHRTWIYGFHSTHQDFSLVTLSFISYFQQQQRVRVKCWKRFLPAFLFWIKGIRSSAFAGRSCTYLHFMSIGNCLFMIKQTLYCLAGLQLSRQLSRRPKQGSEWTSSLHEIYEK